MNKVIIACIALVFFSFHINAQNLRELGVYTQWSSGEVTLNEGKTLVGLVKYNEQTGITHFKGDSTAKESKSFNEQRIVSLSFVDTTTGKLRRFYSLPYKNEVDNTEKLYLFEVLKEFEDWALLSTKGFVNVVDKKENFDPLDRSVVKQTEGLFVMNQHGSITLFLLLNSIDIDGIFDRTTTARKVVDKSVLKEQINNHWAMVESFSKEKKLKFNKKSDLLEILNYYESLLEN